MIRLISLLFLLIFLLGCTEIPSDGVYSLRLDHVPGQADWARAQVHAVRVAGGRPHRMSAFSDIDQDRVHTSTPSCHHGAELPPPIPVELSSFHTESRIYLRLSWPDPTPDRSMRGWSFDGTRWQAGAGLEDGFGLLWAEKGQFPLFSCSVACHLDDFGVQSSRFQAKSRMRMAEKNGRLDLWNWKAGRTGSHGFADDRFVDSEGTHGDMPGELFRPNSHAFFRTGKEQEAFEPGDRPASGEDGRGFDGGFVPAGTTAEGYLTESPVGDRADISAESFYEGGRWTVILSRKLDTGSDLDIAFVPGKSYSLGLSIMDNTLYDHYASRSAETLHLVKAEP